MTDVFISYASEDRERAAMLANALGALGWSIWWDRKIIAGQAFDQAIERELESAKSVVVLWSAHSIASEWVKNEAAAASERGVLVPAMIDPVKLPLEFRRKQTADLTDWNGAASTHGFQSLCEGVAAAIGAAPPRPDMLRGTSSPRRHLRWVWAALALLLVATGLVVYSMGSRQAAITATAPAPTPHIDTPAAPAPPAGEAPASAEALADLVVGKYSGDVIADSKGSSRSNIDVTVTKLDRSKVRVSSDYQRLGTMDINLTRSGDAILNADGDTPFMVSLDKNPQPLIFDPHSEIAYRGTKRN